MVQANLDMTDSMGPGKSVRHMQNMSYNYDTYLICMGLGPSILSVIDKSQLYSGLSYPSSPVVTVKCLIFPCINFSLIFHLWVFPFLIFPKRGHMFFSISNYPVLCRSLILVYLSPVYKN